MVVTSEPAMLTAVKSTAFPPLLRAATNPNRRAIGTWSVGETAAHVSHSYRGLLEVLKGTLDIRIDEIDAPNEQVLAEDPERDLTVLADRVEAGAREYAEHVASIDPDRLVPFFGDIRLPASDITATLLAEVLVHGHDIAHAEGLPWAIEPAHAVVTLEGLIPVLPHFVDEEAAAGLDAVFEIRLRNRAATNYWSFRDGQLKIEESAARPIQCHISRPIQCHISAEPVAFPLMSYNGSDR